MPEEQITLMEPTEELRKAYAAFLKDFRSAGEPRVAGGGGQAGDDFAAFVRKLRDNARGVGLAEGHVPASTYWLVRNGGEILGTANLRHELTAHLLHEDGHIGYSVRPSERRKGYATRMLAMVLAKCRARGLGRVLVTCDRDNVASARVIQKNGGVLENEVVATETGKIKQRYWIEL